MSSATRTSMAFFDVDETLISIKSMVDFYDYFLKAAGHSPEEQRQLHEAARDLLRPGLPREQQNRLFYRRFAGRKVAEVAAAGQHWFEERLKGGKLFHTDVLDALHAHRAAGTTVVLVSGSFSACLDPVSAHCEADLAVCTELGERDGIYTGEVTRAMIGDAKVILACELIAEAGTTAAGCHAYGDHASDLGLLRLAGHPVVVGTDPGMLTVARASGWALLPGTPG
ncbi:HAD family hydrolase [Amycolatopsis sp. H20-H5]|uniref:HAD family hydrolase n=1 Tax=Amycolatopsis sp. H20-H5 TaxID=3046309 RepID=UPI002DB77748|nr:HAD family hydrolase [Amycolatopsis sp. H20-H5]MEC3977390.1 HAD family hydrolase [Amycolatopsis sp. H20-H5]